MDWKEDLGVQIREARKDSFLRQQDLHERANVHVNMISRYERGDAAPELNIFVRLAAALGKEEFRIGEYRVLVRKDKGTDDSQSMPRQMRLEYGKEYVFEGTTSSVKIQPQKEGIFITAAKRKSMA